MELKRRGGADKAKEIEALFRMAWTPIHYRGEEDVVKALRTLMRRLKAQYYVIDEGLVNPRRFPNTISRPPHKVPGIQLADVLAGYYRSRFCGSG